MTILHHPEDSFLAAFAAGTLDLGQHVAIATHLVACALCRQSVRTFECVGSLVLEDLPPTALSQTFGDMEGRLHASEEAASIEEAHALSDVTTPGLPDFVRGYHFSHWRWAAPGLRLRPIHLPYASPTRTFLLKSGPGLKMLGHSHSGIEMTCVLAGAFNHEGGRFAPGDFDFGDGSVNHALSVEADEDCICLIALQGGLRLNGFLGRLMQPFIRF
jgi:putative transcriptional regulator